MLQLAKSLAMTSFFWSTLLQVLQVLQLATSSSMTSFFGVPCYWFATGATGATACKEFNYDVIFWSTLLLVCYRCYSATARKEFSYDVIFLEYLASGLLQVLQVVQLARSSSMTSFFGVPCYWFATGATGATARKEFSCDVIFLEYLATGLLQVLQVLQLARSPTMTSLFWSTLLLVCYRCYRCYSSQGV